MALFKRSPSQEPSVVAPPATARDAPEPSDASAPDVLESLRIRLQQTTLPEAAQAVARRELQRLQRTDPSHGEYTVGLGYLEFILDLPWRKSVRERLDLAAAAKILEQEHHGLAAVKERVLDHLAAAIMVRQAAARILVVDDEPIARENLAHVLRKEGHEVLVAGNGEEALTQLEASPVQLLITDMKMQGMDGLELLQRVQERSPGTDCIIVTGYATVETAVDALKKGAFHYLAKPLNLDRLRAVVQEVLDSQQDARTRLAPVLCFSGPPGTGKTSIGRAIATALGRPFGRLSLAGLRDEAELRGHRRTYVGAMAGRILHEIRRLGCNNPVLMLDELDKVGQDFRGDPASVLLEILDPEQNKAFVDNYLETPFDLSRVLFLTTANTPERLPRPLLDRMEFVPFSSYTLAEKVEIGLTHLAPRQLEAAGLPPAQVQITGEAMAALVREYTREAGVRNLERAIGGVCRRLARQVLTGERTLPAVIQPEDVARTLGRPQRPLPQGCGEALPGVATGLVWSETGGEVIQVEAARMRGSGRLLMTGSLGRVLRESAQAALSHLRSHAPDFLVDPDFFHQHDIHLHIPAGSVPKDGPSAGATIAMALLSLLTGRRFRADTAMTGELTLSGRLLAVGGVKEKILAAAQAGKSRVLLPRAMADAVADLDADVREAVTIIFVDDVRQAAAEALECMREG
ncbi:S16 family serine protease [Megalodesulfovibrio paquesii]